MNTRTSLHQDLLASVVVFLVALPLCMGIAIASGLPPALGIVTGIVGGLVVGFIQGSPMQVSGPAAGLAVIVLQLVQSRGLAGTAIIVMFAGAIQLTAGLLRGGRWFRAVPPSVIHGMLAGIGVLIFAGQFHVMVDDKPKGDGVANLMSLPAAVWKGITPLDGSSHEEAALVGLLTIATLLLWQRLAPRRLKVIPAPLLAVGLATLLATVLHLPIARVPVPDNLLAELTLPTWEAVRGALDSSGLAAAAGLAVIASAETLLCAGAVDKMHTGPRTHFNRELAAQGVGNLLCGFLGAPPMTGVIVRSSANVEAGAKTRLSAILHGGWLLAFVVALPSVLRLIPVSSLAAVLVYTGFKLATPKVVPQLLRYGRSEVYIFTATVLAIVTTDLLKGVLIGLGLSAAKLLWRASHLQLSLEDDPVHRRALLHLTGSATFLRLPDLADALASVPPDRELHVRFEQLDYLDHASLELLMDWEKQHRARGGRVVIEWDELESRYHTPRGAPPAVPSGPRLEPVGEAQPSST